MSEQDIDRLYVIRKVLARKLRQIEAGKILDLSDRQVRRLCTRVREEGSRGVVHGLLGRPSNHRLDPEILGKALSAFHDPLWDGFGPTFACQKLEKYSGISLSDWTARRLMILTDIWRRHRRRAKHRSWRQRRPCLGMLVQLDGSDHDWFEGRGPRCVLIIYIDDATSKILYGEFVKVEDTLTLMRTTKVYLRRWGRPVAFYVDKDSIYKVNRQATIDEELRDAQPITQFTRAMAEFDVEVIPANSPQAKGRVERGFGTHQDRLVKELRLRDICTIEGANEYFWHEYIPEHNASYAVEAADSANAHRPLLRSHDLAAILSIKTGRQVQSDFTVRYESRFFQLEPKQPVRVYRKANITVQERLDGSIHLVYKGRRLKSHEIPKRPAPKAAARVAGSKELARRTPARPRRISPLYAAFTLASRAAPTNPPASAGLQ